eukprot:scaffold9076_cov192-Alexandrium_tamarense.AAC.7
MVTTAADSQEAKIHLVLRALNSCFLHLTYTGFRLHIPVRVSSRKAASLTRVSRAVGGERKCCVVFVSAVSHFEFVLLLFPAFPGVGDGVGSGGGGGGTIESVV